MAEYTYKDVIIDPNSEKAKSCLGKECYFDDNPGFCLFCANNNDETTLAPFSEIRILNDDITEYPFQNGFNKIYYACIIPKKEDLKPEYQPFSNQEEFLNHYAYHKDRLVESSSTHQLSSLGGVWLKDKHLTTFHMVTEIWGDGVIIGDTKMKTVKSGKGEYFTMNDITEWRELLKDYTFLDGTPCGRLVEEKHE